ncbi:MAG TPA: DUF3987 domain-containing protein [Candidatus Cybelea sp.]
MPGNTMVKFITVDDVAGMRRLFAVREPGEAGKTFVDLLVAHLPEIGFAGELFIVDLQATCGVKDPSELHIRNPQAFEAQWQHAKDKSRSVLLAWPEIYPRPVLHPLALHGCAGDFVGLISPQSEAAEAALLLQFLCVAGIAMGANHYVMTESTRHYPRIFPLLLGPTARGRKGTAADHIMRVFRIADEEFVNKHFATGMVSGEGLYGRCAPQGEQTPRADKRLVLFEPEFADVLEVCSREKSTLSGKIRQLYDLGWIEVLRSKEPLKARDVHAGFIGHCTVEEYRALLSKVSMANGFANRFLLGYVERANILPFGGENLTDKDFTPIAGKVNAAILSASEHYAKDDCKLSLSVSARSLWVAFYHLCAQEGSLYPGLIAAMLGRLETNVLRLALIYATLEKKKEIGVEDLRAAIAVGAYARSSTLYAFGPTLGDKKLDKLRDALRDRYPNEMTRTEIQQKIFKKNEPGVRKMLDFLATRGLVAATTEGTRGRPVDSFRAIGPGDDRSSPHAADTLISLIS